jgi:Animal haem peroxidase
MNMNNQAKGALAAGFVAGTITGVIAGMLLTPKTGKETRGMLKRLSAGAIQSLNKLAPWYRLPLPLAVANLVAIRTILREQNLYDTTSVKAINQPVLKAKDTRHLTARTADGSFNDLEHPAMGRAGARFGRNFPLDQVHPEEVPALLEPNPRTISRELMTRNTFQPATTLNLLAGAWLQFMVHDWFNHGPLEEENPWELPLLEDDPWPEHPMRVRRTRRDPTRLPDEKDLPPTFINTSAHWWDGSQVYGNNEEIVAKLRSAEAGKLAIGRDGLSPVDPETGIDIAGLTDNWWIGLSLLHTLFTLEHNAICDRLRTEYPSWSDDNIYDHARLINAALMAKIHTTEWTPGILNHPATRYAMRGTWWGLMGEQLYRRFGRISKNEVISGIPGSPTDHHTALYAMTEEFVAVYRMHPLMPDEFSFRSLINDELLQERTFPEVEGKNSRTLLEQISMADLFYSFGTSHPGGITLHNYPRFLQQLKRPDGTLIDLAAVDMLRDRERGVPRYNKFRQLIHMPPVKSFEELTNNKAWTEQIRSVYDNDINRVDLMVGLYAEPTPRGFGFSDTAFRIFTLMATRRLKSDRFFTKDYTPQVYTPAGIAWIDDNDMATVLLRHFPSLRPVLSQVKNAFAPWPRAKS